MLHHGLRARNQSSAITVSYIDSATGSGSGGTIVIPSGAASGDLGVLIDRNSSLSSDNLAPSGWTQISNLYLSSSGTTRTILSYKKLGSSDPGATITGMGGGPIINKIMFIFRFSSVPSSFSIADLGEEITSSNPTAKTVNAQTEPYVVVGAIGSSGTPGWTSTWYDGSVLNSYARLAYKLFNSGGSSVSIDMGDDGSRNAVQCCAILPNY